MATMSYSAAAKKASGTQSSQRTSSEPKQQPAQHQQQHDLPVPSTRRSPSSSQQPIRQTENENVYILTLLTDKAHHQRMTDLRNKYFPKHLNKLAAHITLFHALPESRLESSIIPRIQEVAKTTHAFPLKAANVGKLGKRGIAVWIPRGSSGDQRTKEVFDRLQGPWKKEGWLSEQDSHGVRPHYTIMNKVDDEADIARALEELQETFRDHEGVAEGLGLWRYVRGRWKWVEAYPFQKEDDGAGS